MASKIRKLRIGDTIRNASYSVTKVITPELVDAAIRIRLLMPVDTDLRIPPAHLGSSWYEVFNEARRKANCSNSNMPDWVFHAIITGITTDDYKATVEVVQPEAEGLPGGGTAT